MTQLQLRVCLCLDAFLPQHAGTAWLLGSEFHRSSPRWFAFQDPGSDGFWVASEATQHPCARSFAEGREGRELALGSSRKLDRPRSLFSDGDPGPHARTVASEASGLASLPLNCL